jgi:hypothetical protein
MTAIDPAERAKKLAKKAADAVIAELEDRSGFDHWWGSIPRGVQREIRGTLAKLIKQKAIIDSILAVCAERERELLELKGPCSVKDCRLHYAHAGPCDVRPPGEPTDAP